MNLPILVQEGNSWTRSAFLSSFFTLVGTHGLHVSIGLFWMAVMMAQVFCMRDHRRHLSTGLSSSACFGTFLDLVWIFIFTFVYLMGVI